MPLSHSVQSTVAASTAMNHHAPERRPRRQLHTRDNQAEAGERVVPRAAQPDQPGAADGHGEAEQPDHDADGQRPAMSFLARVTIQRHLLHSLAETKPEG